MRLSLRRPDLRAYAQRFDVPAARADSPVTVTWAGVTTLLIDDGGSAVLTDGFFSRPSLFTVATRPLVSSLPRIEAGLAHLGVQRLDAVTPGRAVTAGAFDLTLVEGAHCPPDRYPGPVTAPVRPPARVSAYRCGEAWSTLVHHRPSGRRLLIVGSAGFVPGALSDRHADVVYLGVGQLGLQPPDYLTAYWQQTVRTVGARRVVLIHWDDFFRPLHRPLRALPRAVDDLDASMRVLTALADADGVALHLPTLWQRSDPWR